MIATQIALPINHPSVDAAAIAAIQSTQEKCECLKCQIGRNFNRAKSRKEEQEATRYFKMMRAWVWWSAVIKLLSKTASERDMMQALMDFGMTDERPTMPGSYRACLFSLNIATLSQVLQHVRLAHEMIDGEMTVNEEKVKAYDQAEAAAREERGEDEHE